MPLTDDARFKTLLRRAGRQDPMMRAAQDALFDERFFRPAIAWAEEHRFELPLSALVIYDSFIHSGSILWPIRQMFDENPPSLGGDEKAWTQAYVAARQRWLGKHRRAAVRRTVYRTRCLSGEIARGN